MFLNTYVFFLFVEENADVVPTDVLPSDGWETSKLMQLCSWNCVRVWFVQRRDLQIVQNEIIHYFL
jgi:hypothetical protein